jgi:hypothetical protein
MILAGTDSIGAWGSSSDTIVPFGLSTFDTKGTLLNAWLANVPQLILSVCYLTFNSLCTAMAGAYEWNHLAVTRKGLRVTKPKGQQRSTYFLQLPFKWAIPLTVTSGLLHWLISESFFFIRLDMQDRDGNPIRQDTLDQSGNIIQKGSKSACGFSALSLLVLCAVFLALLAVVLLIGTWRFQVRLPFAASCSLVVSAACHPPHEEDKPHLGGVKWGVVEGRVGGIRHCSLSTKAVKKPKVGVKYA